jgi:hypothetical protein
VQVGRQQGGEGVGEVIPRKCFQARMHKKMPKTNKHVGITIYAC